MPSLISNVRQAADGVAVRYDITLRPGDIGTNPTASLAGMIKYLRHRTNALQEAEFELSRICDELDAILPFAHLTEEGWDGGKAGLIAALQEDQVKGLARWLDSWFIAAANGCFPALERLTEDIGLPPIGQSLLDRARTATVGLTRRDFNLLQPMLEAGIAGIDLGGSVLPDQATRNRLSLLLLRVAVESKAEDPVADPLFDRARQGDWPLAVVALQARLRRLRGTGDVSAVLDPYTIDDAADPDLAIELIMSAQDRGPTEYPVQLAERALDAIPRFRTAFEVFDGLVTHVPAEIWLATAQRGIKTRNEADFNRAMELVEAADDFSEYFLGQSSLTKASGAEVFNHPAEVRFAALREAGRHLVWTDDAIPAALDAYRQALQLRPDDPEALFGYADALQLLAWESPLGDIRGDLLEVLGKIEKAFENGVITPELSWGFLAESNLRQLLGRDAKPEARHQNWLAFMASVRGVLYQPTDWRRWSSLAGAARELNLFRVALAFAKHAFALEDNLKTQGDLVVHLTNAGDHGGATALRAPETRYDKAVVAYAWLYSGDPRNAVEIFSAIDLKDENGWAGTAYVTALVLTDDFQKAKEEVDSLHQQWSGRQDEGTGIEVEAFWNFINGDFEKACKALSAMVEPSDDSTVYLALFEFLTGRQQEGTARLKQLFATTSDLRLLRGWQMVSRPEFIKVTLHYSVTPPPLEMFDALVDKRIAELAVGMTAFREMTEAVAKDAADMAIPKGCKPLGQMLLRLIDGDPDRANGDIGEAKSAVEEADWTLATALCAAWNTDATKKEPTAEAEEEAAEHEDPSAAPSDGAAKSIEMKLPASWFAGHDDPVKTHPIFLRYLPEARIRFSAIPAVRVVTDATLEPDGYLMQCEGAEPAVGLMAAGQSYLAAEVAEFLGLGTRATPVDENTVAVPAEMGLSPLATLLHRTAAEMVVRRLEQLVRDGAPEKPAS